MEKLLHYAWKHRIYPLRPLQTTSGEELEIIDPGIPNENAGPDFFNAKVKIGRTVWAGNVEIHQASSDWFRHGHHKDSAYNNVILHVAALCDKEVQTLNGKYPAQFQMEIPETVRQNYAQLQKSDDYPRCHEIIPQLTTFMVHSWMSALVYERMTDKARLVIKRMKALNGDWENAFFITLARNLGFGLNGDAFEQWAASIPLRDIAKHRDHPFQIEAVFMGQAGLLDPASLPERGQKEAPHDEYFCKLQKEYAYLSHKFQLHPLPWQMWKFMRTRPQNFPHLRISQLARMFHEEQITFSIIRNISETEPLRKKLQMETNPYWEDHYLFGYPSPHSSKRISRASADLIIINTIVPTLFAYGTLTQQANYAEQAINLLEQIKPENNHIIRIWQECGLKTEHAADSQALIQLKREYCDKHECLRCRFGYEFLRNTKNLFQSAK